MLREFDSRRKEEAYRERQRYGCKKNNEEKKEDEYVDGIPAAISKRKRDRLFSPILLFRKWMIVMKNKIKFTTQKGRARKWCALAQLRTDI